MLDLCNPDSSISSEINDNGIQDSSGSGVDENSQKNQKLNNGPDRPQRVRNPPKRLIEELGQQEHAKIALIGKESVLELTPSSYAEASSVRK